MSTLTKSEISSIKEKMKTSKGEQNFDLSLQTLVSGIDETGKDFKERTELCSISSKIATFWLKTKVLADSLLNLSLYIPKTFILENSLQLNVTGEVLAVKSESNKNSKNLISIQLKNTYKINQSSHR